MKARVLLIAATFALGASACTHDKPNFVYMPDMMYSPAFKAQAGAMMKPVQGTVPRDYVSYPYSKNLVTDAPVISNVNPVRPTADVVARGQVAFNTYCAVCHGPNGEGDGSIIPKFPRPPSLQSDKIRGYKDGQIFHVITMGQNLMPTYATQVEVPDRWAIVHYIRALQKAKHPSAQDLEAAKAAAAQE